MKLTTIRTFSDMRVVVVRPLYIRFSSCRKAKAARAVEADGVDDSSAGAAHGVDKTAFPLEENVKTLKEAVPVQNEASKELEEAITAVTARSADLTRLIIGLAILSNATVIFSAFLRASLSASPDNLAGQLLMQYWPQLWVGLEWGVGGVSYWWGRYLYRSKLNCLWGLSLIELSILVLIHAPYMCVPQVQH